MNKETSIGSFLFARISCPVKSLDKKVLATKTIDDLIQDSGVDIKKDTASGQLNRNNPDLKYKKVEAGVTNPETQKKITEISDAKKTKRIETIQKVNNWTNNWFENNAGKYDSYEKTKTQLIKKNLVNLLCHHGLLKH